jgi:hypothetical protein
VGIEPRFQAICDTRGCRVSLPGAHATREGAEEEARAAGWGVEWPKARTLSLLCPTCLAHRPAPPSGDGAPARRRKTLGEHALLMLRAATEARVCVSAEGKPATPGLAVYGTGHASLLALERDGLLRRAPEMARVRLFDRSRREFVTWETPAYEITAAGRLAAVSGCVWVDAESA